MRIGYLTYGLDRSPTGIGRYAVELLRAMALIPGPHELVLLTTERSDPYELWPRFERHHLPGCRLLPGLLSLGQPLVSWAARRYRLDLIHDPNGIAPFLWPSLPVPSVVTIHDAFAYVYPATQARLDVWRCRTLLPPAARRASLVITDSAHSRHDLSRFLGLDPAKLHSVPLAADQRFRPVSDLAAIQALRDRYALSGPYLLYTGGLNPRKNIPALLKAFALVRAGHPELRLVIAGGYQWGADTLEATIAQLGLAGAVVCTGYIADADLPALYSGAVCFVFPSLYEGFGLPPLEALACDTPVVCSNSSALPEVVGDAALLIEPHDSAGLATAIRRVLEEPGLAAELRARGLRRAAQFSWERTASATLALYSRALGRDTREAAAKHVDSMI